MISICLPKIAFDFPFTLFQFLKQRIKVLSEALYEKQSVPYCSVYKAEINKY